jgi:RHS repeat-associated protein
MTSQVSTPASGSATTTTDGYPAAGSVQPHAISSQTVTTPSGSTSTDYGYDSDGQLTSESGASSEALTWNDTGQLGSVTTSAGTTSYIYDADGNLLLQQDPGSTTLYLSDEQITLTGSTLSGVRYYAIGGQTVAARTSAGDVYYLTGDQEGTQTLAISSATLAVSERFYDPYGNPVGTATGTWPGDQGFQDGTADASTGLTDIGAREYDPGTSSFISPDPLLTPADPQDLNAYAYAQDSPPTGEDPTGMLISGGGSACSGGCGTVNWGDQPGDDGQPTSSGKTPAGGSDGSQPEATPDQIGEAARALPLQVSLRFIEWVEDGQDSYNTDPAGTAWAFEALYSFCGTSGAGCGHALLGQLEEDYWELQAPLFIGEGLGYAAGGDTLTGDFDGGDAADPTRSEISEAGNAAADLDELDCGQSFTPATLVLLAGGKTVPIAGLRPGDKVLATNVKTGKTQPETVTAVLVNHDRDLYDLTVRSGNKTAVIDTTSNHLFWDPSLDHWVPAGKLKPGTHLKTPDGQVAVVVGGSVPAVRDGWMWDLTVPGSNDHDFYVAVATTAVLVHNCTEGEEIANNIADHAAERAQAGDGTHYVSGVSPQGLPSYVHQVLDGEVPGVETRYLSGGRVGYWDPANQAVIIEDGDGGTVLTPEEGYDYFEGLR